MKYLQLRSIGFGLLSVLCVQSIFAQKNYNTSAEDYSNLKITEIAYHPVDVIEGTDTTEGKDLEFIEFKNIGESSINLTGLVLDSAVYYEFPNDVELGPKQFWVIVSKPSKFLEFYGVEASGNFSNNLANSGDEILLRDASDNKIINFIYDDHAPWPEQPDGDGYTLVSTYINPTGNPADEAYWRASLKLNGSPFKDDVGTNAIETNELPFNTSIEVYPNPVRDFLSVNINDENFSGEINVGIYAVNGSLIFQTSIFNKEIVALDNLNIESGIYIIRLETKTFIETKKLIFSGSK